MNSQTTEFYTLSLHDALPISGTPPQQPQQPPQDAYPGMPPYSPQQYAPQQGAYPGMQPYPQGQGMFIPPPSGGTAITAAVDRKSTRLNSSHMSISYAVFCLKK